MGKPMDVRGQISKNLYNLSFLIHRSFSTFVMSTSAKLTGIRLGSKCKFVGNTRFYRRADSSISIGNNCEFRSTQDSNLIGINHKCIIATHQTGAKIVIGENCGFSGTVIGAFTEINIGDNVRCGANTLITDGDWHSNDPRVGSSSPVKIGDNVWLGLNVVVLKGVSIGKNSLIGANSTVVKDIPPDVIAGGNPCKVLKSLVSNE